MASHFLDHWVPLIPQRFCPDSSWVSISGYLYFFYLSFLYIHNHLHSHATPLALFAFEHESQSLSSGEILFSAFLVCSRETHHLRQHAHKFHRFRVHRCLYRCNDWYILGCLRDNWRRHVRLRSSHHCLPHISLLSSP